MTTIYSSDFNSLSGWNTSTGGGTVSLVTQDGRSCVKFLKVGTGTAPVSIHRNMGTFTATVRKISITQNLNSLTAEGENNSFHLVFGLGAFQMALVFASGGLYSSNRTKLCTITQAQWQIIDLYIDFTTTAKPVISCIVVDGETVYSLGGILPIISSALTEGLLVFYVYGYSATPTVYLDSITITDDLPPYAISGTLKEKESDAAGSPEHYLIINPATGAVLVAGTAEADGSFNISAAGPTEYALIMPDKDGDYAPTCLNHYITGVPL